MWAGIRLHRHHSIIAFSGVVEQWLIIRTDTFAQFGKDIIARDIRRVAGQKSYRLSLYDQPNFFASQRRSVDP